MELAEETGVAMDRCVRPEGALGEPSLAGFSDASTSAMCAVVYVVWDATPHQEARLILGKVRVATKVRTPGHGHVGQDLNHSSTSSSLHLQQGVPRYVFSMLYSSLGPPWGNTAPLLLQQGGGNQALTGRTETGVWEQD